MSTAPDSIPPIVAALRQAGTVCIVGHVRPDGDCVGSQLGLALALRDLGKRVTVWNEDPLPRKLEFLDPHGLFGKPEEGREFECVVATDSASFERLGRAGGLHRIAQAP
jgi:phosphoesterase RecJ-like protein